MKKYQIEIIETTCKVVEVLAKDESEAQELVQEQYKNGEHVLDHNDFQDYQINII